MLKLFYDKDIDYFEIFFTSTPNYGDDVSSDIIEFKSERDDSVVGYGIYHPLRQILTMKQIDSKYKIAAICYIERKIQGLTEKEWAQKLNLSYRTYQRIEEGEISKIDDFLKIQSQLKRIDLSRVFKAS